MMDVSPCDRKDTLMQSLLPAAVLLLLVVTSPAGAQIEPSTAAEIAPAGKLRVGFQTASPILAKQAQDGSVGGVAVDLGKFVARKLDVAFLPVAYANQQAFSESFGKDEWDVVIGVRSALAHPGPDFMLADAMYIAAPGREFLDASSVDAAGVRVGVSRGGGSDRFLSQSLATAQVVRVPGGVSNAVEALRVGAVDVWAANPVTLQEIQAALPAARIVPGAWTTGRYAASLPEGRSVNAQTALAEIVDEAKRTGVVQGSIDRAGFSGVHVAPGHSRPAATEPPNLRGTR
jgi:polar amino acid transport system substrate-binding protein